MASQINASNSGFGGIVSTGDSSGVLQLQTTGTTALTIDTSQNVGIGTSSPQNDAGYKTLTVNGTSGGQVSFKTNDANIGSIYSLSTALNLTTGTSIPMVFQTNGSERMRIDSSGNVGIGVTPSTWSAGKSFEVGGVGNTVWGQTGDMSIGQGFYYSAGYKYALTGSAPNFLEMYNGAFIFRTAASGTAGNAVTWTQAMTLDSSGNLLVGTNSATCNKIVKIRSQGQEILIVQNGTAYTADFFEVSSEGFNGAAAAIWVGKNSSTNRSINAGGTVNASGADYAEYMTKASNFTLAKGDVVGIDANGKLTNVFADAVSFCVKSTDPSYVGGDTWGNEEAIGKKPKDKDLLSEWETKLETARQLVDRIAFAGQVPVNVLGATAGQYIIPVNDNGLIKGESISNPTFEQYQIAVGKVIAIESDGRAKIIVKVA